MEILFLVIFLLILASLHFKSPTHCVCCYLLFYTSFGDLVQQKFLSLEQM